MTTPIGSGKNARYGYEDDHGSDPAAGSSTNMSRSEDDALVCAAPPDIEESSSVHGEESAGTGSASPGACAVEPDYVTLSGTAGIVLSAAVSATVDRYGHVYTAGGGSLGVTSGIGLSYMRGYLRDPEKPCEPPSEEQLGRFLTGGSVNVTGGSGVTVGVAHSSGMTAREIGVSTPTLGATYTVGAPHN